MKKRLLSFALCLALLLTLFPVTGSKVYASDKPLAPTNVTFDGTYVTWENPNESGVVKYVRIDVYNTEDTSVKITNYGVSSIASQYKVSESLVPGYTYYVELYFETSDGTVSDRVTTTNYTVPGEFTKQYISNATFTDTGILSWDTYSTYLPRYEVTLYKQNGDDWSVVLTDHVTWIEKTKDYSYYMTEGKTYKATVTAQQGNIAISLVTEAKNVVNISGLDVSVATAYYTGSTIHPTVTIDGLTEGTDYTVTYPDEGSVEVGTYTLTVTGIGDYTGSKEVEYTIADAKPLAPTNVTFNGTYVTWENPNEAGVVSAAYVDIYNTADTSGYIAYKGLDINDTLSHQVDISNILIPGYTYYVKVWFSAASGESDSVTSDSYTVPGEFTKQYISNAKFTEEGILSWDAYSTYNPRYAVVLYEKDGDDWNRVKGDITKTGVTSYDFSSYMTEGNTYKASVTARQGSVNIPISLETEAKYMVNISGLDISVAEASYTGSVIHPTVTIEGLTEGTDFTVTYPDEGSVAVGTYTLTVSGKGDYTGSKEVEYTISSRDISILTWADIENCTYTGSAIKPKITMDGLTEGTDFTVTYSEDCITIGPKTVTITGIGSCTGTVTKTYLIVDDQTQVGSAGDEVGYVFDATNKVLTLYKTGGNGVMEGYSSFTNSVFRTTDIYSKVEKIIVEEGVTVIGSCALCNLNKCTSITLPDTLTRIEWGSFSGAVITEIDIPASVTFIAGSSFNNCADLTTIHYLGTQEQWNANVTCNISDETVLAKITYADHTHSYTEVSRVEPTCAKDGTITYRCSCGKEYVGAGDPATGEHTYDSENKCSVCGEFKIISASETSGVCGKDITWAYDENTKTLTLTGTGPTSSYGNNMYGPFNVSSFKTKCEKIVIGEGITAISGVTFLGFTNVTEVDLPTTLTYIGYGEFHNFTSLTTVNMYPNVTEFGYDLFDGSGLTTINFFGTKEQYDAIEKDATNDTINSVTVHYYGSEPTVTLSSCTADGTTVYSCSECDETYTITTAKVSTVKLATTSYVYNGKAKSIVVTVADSDGKALTKGTDYTVSSVASYKAVGTYTVTVTGKGNYSFTKKLTYKIIPKTAAVSKLTAGKKCLTVKMSAKPTTAGATYYQVAYKVKGTSKWVTKFVKTQSVTLKSLKKGKQYYVKVRAYKKVSGKGYYGAWSAVKTSAKIK